MAGCIALASLGFGQSMAGNAGARNRRKNAPKSKLLPLHQIMPMAGFKVVELPKDKYILMASEICEFPKGTAGLKAPHTVVMLTYGAKVGGIVRFYQTKAVEGVKPEEFVRKLGEVGTFHDVNRSPSWTV